MTKTLFSTLILSCIGLAGCDLTIHELGQETATAGDGDGGSPTGGGEPDACILGEKSPAPDGCNTCVCTENGWACAELGCTGGDVDTDGAADTDGDVDTDGAPTADPALPLETCGPQTPFDPLFVGEASITDDTLHVNVSSSGGCAEHVYGGCWDGTFMESFPVQVQLRLSHDANDDACDAIIHDEFSISLESLRDSYRAAYQTEQGTIIIRLPDGESVVYAF